MFSFSGINYKSVALKLIFSVLAFSLIHTFLNQLFNGYDKETYNITEFLINYQGGFIRRGLLGEIILKIYNIFNILPYHQILSISIISFSLLIIFFIIQFLKRRYSLGLILFTFLLGNPILNNFWVRKDCLLMLCFIGVIFFARRKTNFLNLILLNLIFVFSLLLHEAFGFFTFPIVFFMLFFKDYSLDEYKKKSLVFFKSFFAVLFFIFPSIITFLSTLYFKGSKTEANIIWNSLNGIYFPFTNGSNSAQGSIKGLGWTTDYAFSLFKNSIIKINNESIYIPLLTIIVILIIYIVLSNIQILQKKTKEEFDKLDKLKISKLLLFQLVTIFPLFIIGIDYGRWIFFWVITSFVLIIYNVNLKFLKIVDTPINLLNQFFEIKSKKVLLLLAFIIGFPIVFCDSTMQQFLYKTPLIQVLKFLSKFFIWLT